MAARSKNKKRTAPPVAQIRQPFGVRKASPPRAIRADHHNRIGDYVHISPGARLGGGVSVGDGAWIGIGSTVLDNLRVGSGAIVGGGAVVIRNVKPGMIVVGVPAGNLHKSPDPWAPASRKKKK